MADEAVVEQVPLDQIEDQAEYVKARQAGVETIEREKPAEVEEPEEAEPEAAKAEEEKPKGKGNGFQKRIDKLIREKSDLERRLEALEKGTPAKPAEAAKPKEGEPKQEDYTDYEEYLLDKATYRVEQKQLAAKQASERQTEEQRTKAIFDSHRDREDAAKAKYDDYAEVVSVKMPWTGATQAERNAQAALQTALVEDEKSAEIFYYLGKNPDELAAMADMTPAQIVKAVGRISDKLDVQETEQEEPEEQEQAEEKPVRKAPTPIKPINTGSTRASISLDKVESQREYVRLREKGRQR